MSLMSTMTSRLACLIGLVLAPASAIAQDRPVIFIHGFMSDGGTWQAAAARLQEHLALTAETPSLPSRAHFESQADQLEQLAGRHGGEVVTVGHSNGGIAARQWSQQHPVAGIVTVGTPHGGVPLVRNAYGIAGYNSTLLWAINDVYRLFAQGCCDWQYMLSASTNLWSWLGSMTSHAWPRVVSAIALDTALPVTMQMMPGSPYLSSLNGPGNLAREAGNIPGRVGVVSTAHNFYWGGILRAAFPDEGDTLYYLRESMRIGLESYAAYIYAHAPYQDWWAFEIADGMMFAALYLRYMDDAWCRSVSVVGADLCYANDTIVPQWSQVYPGGVFLDTGWSGPAHTQQARMSDAYLERALTTFVGVGQRPAPPPSSAIPAAVYGDIGFDGGGYEVGDDQAFVGWDWNDRISSLHVPAGRTIVLYEHAGYGGQVLTLSGDSADLRDYAGPGIDGTWNDAVSSIQVR
jgi:pimeloyl-ACP methyl ester carboxylesterase